MSIWPMKPRSIGYSATVHTVRFLPSGKCYGLDIIVDDSIEAQPEIYMEAGDHETPLHMGHSYGPRAVYAPHGQRTARAL